MNERSPEDIRLHTWTKWFVFVLTIALLADLAVETWIIGSDLRYWVVGAVMLYFVGHVALFATRRHLWRKIHPNTWAAINLTVFQATVATSAIVVGDFNSGIAVFGLSTTSSLSVILATATIALTMPVLLWRGLPLAVRGVLAAVSIYAIVAFAMAALANTGFVDLFRGEAVLERLPKWAQGSNVGAFVLLPILLLFFIAWLLRSSCALLISTRVFLVIAAALVLIPPLVAVDILPLPNNYAENDGAHPDSLSVDGQEFAASFDAVERLADSIPRDTFDIDVAIAAAGSSPQDMLNWVQKNTALVAYQGMLRGSHGVLMDRRGNSLDRSLLLGAMFNRIGFESRLARVKLSETDAAELRVIAYERFLQKTSVVDDTGGAELLHGDDFELVLEKHRESSRVVTEKLLKILEHSIDPTDASWEPAVNTGIADHWWVQVRQDGLWVDMDPSAPESARRWPGDAQFLTADAVPDKLKHRLTLRLALKTPIHDDITLIEHRFDSSSPDTAFFDLYQFPMSLAALPDDKMRNLDALELAQLIQQEEDWLPVLFVNGSADSIPTSMFFSVNGDVFNKNDLHPNSTRLGSAIGRNTVTAVGSATSIFDGLLDDAAPVATTVPSIHEWLEFNFEGPGYRTRSFSRAITQNSTNDASGSLSLYFNTTGLITVAELSAEFVANRIATSFSGRIEALEQLDHEADPGKRKDAMFDLISRSGFPAPLAGFSVIRRHSGGHTASWQDGLAVYTTETRLRYGQENKLVLRHGFDIVNTSDGYWKKSHETRSARIYKGVFDTFLEARLLEGGASSQNVALAFEAAPSGWSTIESEAAIQTLDLDRGIRESLTGELKSGFIAIAPSEMLPSELGPFYGWWRIDPVSGQTLGIDSNLRGSAFFEYMIVLFKKTREQVAAFRILFCTVVSAGGGAMAYLEKDSMGRYCDTDYLSATGRNVRTGLKFGACMIAATTFGVGADSAAGVVAGGTAYGYGAAIGLGSVAETVGRAGTRAYMRDGCE